ncbi:N-alpha-acetyltransferase 38, NatC auxiliary subunit-like [Hibiscus syriacus]|uniref:N-alpha-acetyltransferase 38, NatC auxiliary subunit-like n=1 Tax=Hibiscus syriacus TaxID=106335 RepID=A0A6A3AD33_HIBSY|nr:probable calcium-binding protein CML35 [Hibiscus syriacus]KAE8701657.1 N-alpha-acetyltransferase 38, NatC auxiliary subunit-like [Hibiscus syriacus]
MNLIDKLSPKRLFRSNKKDRSVISKFDPSSSSSGSGTLSSSSSESIFSTHQGRQYPSTATAGFATPTSVLPQISGDRSDFSAKFYQELCQAFKMIHKDNDGVIKRSELEALLSKVARQPPSREEVSFMLSEVDGEGDGYISLETLMGLACGEPAGERERRETFDIFDTDHDGRITAEELMAFYRDKIGDKRCTLEDCQRMIARVDENAYGFVCFEDFSRMMELQR